MDRQTWEKRQGEKQSKAEMERIIRGFGGRFGANGGRGIERPRRADGTMMSDKEISLQEGARNEKTS